MAWKNNFVEKFLFESRAELAKVVWPTRVQVVQHSLLVIGLSAALAAYFGLVDFLLSQGLEGVLAVVR